MIDLTWFLLIFYVKHRGFVGDKYSCILIRYNAYCINTNYQNGTQIVLEPTQISMEQKEAIYLHGLNKAQKEAVLHTEGPLLILAGAGAGKTKTLTHRILHLLHQGVDPDQILAITFTNKAAREMRDRLIKLVENDKTLNFPIAQNRFPFVSTFHALGVYILRKHGAHIGISKNFTIYDRGDSKTAVKEALMARGYDPKQFDPGKILSAISKAKGDAETCEEFKNKRQDYYGEVVAEAWETYEANLSKDKALDFDDLLHKTALLLEKNEEVRNHYQNTFKYVHIDEYQDTNTVQYRIAELLSAKYQNIAVVGDIDQAIYGWRGAKISNMLRFEKDFKDAKTILLEENYRSTKNILEAANGVIAKNIYRKEKNLFTSNVDGDKLGLYVAMDENDEATHIAQSISTHIASGVSPDEIAVLYRANFQSRALEDACLFNNIPYHVLGTKFFDRKEVKDALSYIKLALNPDSGADLKRVINTPTRGIGKTTILKVLEGKKEELADSFKIKVNSFYNIIQDIRNFALHHPPSEVVKFMLTRSGIEQELKQDDEEERLENVRELVSLAKRYDDQWVAPTNNTNHTDNPSTNTTQAGDHNVAEDPFIETSPKHALYALEKFIEDASLLGEQDTLDDKQTKGSTVKLMTVHASKGLEFDYVYITGLEKDLFPHVRHGDGSQAQLAPEDAEEERRLFYVALTRARKKLHLSYALIRTIFGSKVFNQASEFIEDIDQSLIESENPGGELGGGLLGRLIEF